MVSSRDTSASESLFARVQRHPRLLTLGALLALVFLMFADVLLTSEAVMLSKLGTDGDSLFIPWREFGFGQLQQGNLPLWNPHILSGCPFFGGFQSALLYPPNWMHLILSIDKAFNLEIAFHTLLTGLLMYAWTWHRGLSPVASLVSATLLMFGAPFFFHIYPGHLTPLAVMAWAPLLFLVCDGLATRPSLQWCLLGALAVAMQILGGYPQYFFYTLIAVGVYGLLTFAASPYRVRAVLGATMMYLAGFALSAVQLFAGLQATGESVRGDRGLPYHIAASFSFPPENFVTFLAPNFFGDMTTFPYWGRCYLWEMSVFMGVTGLILALCGVVFAPPKDRRPTLVAAVMIVLLLVLALGANTPLFKVLYSYVPGFDKFRSNSKFIYPAAIFLALLSGYGLDCIIQAPRRVRSMAWFVLLLAGIICVAGFWIQAAAAGPESTWSRMVSAVAATGESYFPVEMYGNPEFVKQAARHAGSSLYVAGATAVVLAVLMFMVNKHADKVVYAVAGLAILEVFAWSWMNRPTFELAEARKPALEQFLKQHPGDYRTVNPSAGYSAMSTVAREIAGYEPCVSRRYAEFIAFTQGRDPDQVDAYLSFAGHHPLFRMLRCRYVFLYEDSQWKIGEFKDDMPRLVFVPDYAVVKGRDRIFDALAHAAFDPEKQVILESEPEPRPQTSQSQPTATVVDSSTDHLTIEAELSEPAILLITDNYSEGWRAVALPGSVQQKYQVLPANYILRAIPLAAGKHRLRVEYSPLAFRVGGWVTILCVVIYLGLSGWSLWRWKQLLRQGRSKMPAAQRKVGKRDW